MKLVFKACHCCSFGFCVVIKNEMIIFCFVFYFIFFYFYAVYLQIRSFIGNLCRHR
uniref:Uncharacterized protein n=1 Tax=Glossina morsitans morsitans TaxID=37546 RepID=A0ABK9NGC7_GLOMM